MGGVIREWSGTTWVDKLAETSVSDYNNLNNKPSLIETHDFSMAGTVVLRTGTGRIYVENSYTISTVRASVGTAPTGASIIVDLNKNGTTVYTTQSARPTILVTTNTATGNSPAVTSLTAGDYLTVDVDQVGSTVAGADLTVSIRLLRTS